MKKRVLSLILAFVMVLGMLPVGVFAAGEYPFAVAVDGEEMTDISESVLSWSGWMGDSEVTCYTVKVPEDAAEATLTFEEDKQWSYYDSTGNYVGEGDTSWSAASEHTVAIQDSNGDGELDGISVQIPNEYSTEFFILFVYGSGEEGGESSDAPFLNIKIGGEAVAEESISYKGIFELGDYDADEQQDTADYYDYVHKVPYYHVSVPCGTPSVDVTYSADTNILNDGTNAYGYKTDLEVDAVSSATVRGVTFQNAYTENEDGTQTVKTPVTGYTFDEEGNGHAITLEQDGGSYEAICLFSFEYDGKNHVYDSGKVTTQPGCETEGVKTFNCTCGNSYTEPVAATGHDYQDGLCANCGEADPDYAASSWPFAVTVDGEEMTDISESVLSWSGWMGDSEVTCYTVKVPEDAAEATLTFEEDKQWSYYDSTGNYVGEGDTSWSAASEHTVAIQDSNGDGELDGISVQIPNEYSTEFFILFVYGSGEGGDSGDVHTHSYTSQVTKEATCTEEGVKTFTCSCSDSYTEQIPAAGHSYDAGVETTPATCVADGVKTFTCSKCDADTEGYTKTEKISKLGHKYDDGVVDPQPTCTEAGVKTYTCSRCADGTEGHTKAETVAPTGHDFQNGKCVNCDEVCPQQDENGVFQIGTYEELLWFAEEVNGGNTGISGVLTADITLPENWPGIGNSTNKFAGSFDGQNHTVTLSGSVWGLFAYAMGTWDGSFNAKVPVVIENVITAGTVKNAPVVQRAGYARISNCVNKANVVGNSSYIGGIVGNLQYALQYNSVKYNDLLIENCINEGDIEGVSCIGGILGEGLAGVKLQGCVNTGDISGVDNVGGLAGYLQEGRGTVEIRNSYNTGKVAGNRAAGIVGTQYNGVALINCYNAGEATYGIAAYVYNTTASATNTYYRSDLSVYGGPEKNGYGGYNTTVHGQAKKSAYMGSPEFAALLGDAFQESCGGPVLTWQEAKAHNMDNGICTGCKYGYDKPDEYTVHKSAGDGYEIVGDTVVKEGNDYTFEIAVLDGYYATDSFAVYVNGVAVTDVDGVYKVEKPTGHFYVTVEGVKELEGILPVSLPGAGHGYRVVPCEGYDVTVESGKDFKFVVNFMAGFQAGENFTVEVNGEEVKPDAEGVYTVENVIKKLTVTVDGVDIIPTGETVTIGFSMTEGENLFHYLEETDTLMLDKYLDVPYFDIGQYDLAKYYYNPYCYVDENGNIRGQQKGGTRESAYGVVTVMHAYIYLTEVYYLGLDEEHAGTGYSDSIDSDGDGKSDFDEAVSWTQGPGSSFMNLWGKGTNLNYHVNYRYPVAYEGWGSTSDQIALKDGDMITVHLLHQGSGSAFGTFVVNDDNNEFNDEDRRDNATVRQGEKIKLTLYWGDQGDNYTTSFVAGPNKDLYWVEAGDEMADVREWSREDFGAMTAETMVTDENGEVIIDTAGLEAGTYYIAAEGGFTKGTGKPGADGFVSAGAESGPAYFVLTVEEDETQIKVGDVNMDGVVDSRDANLVISYYYGNVELTQEQLGLADVDGIVGVDIRDANLINSHYYGMLEVFPVEG